MDLETLIGAYGFPIVMCLWFMFRTDKLVKENTDVTREVRDLLYTMKK